MSPSDWLGLAVVLTASPQQPRLHQWCLGASSLRDGLAVLRSVTSAGGGCGGAERLSGAPQRSGRYMQGSAASLAHLAGSVR